MIQYILYTQHTYITQQLFTIYNFYNVTRGYGGTVFFFFFLFLLLSTYGMITTIILYDSTTVFYDMYYYYNTQQLYSIMCFHDSDPTKVH